MTPPTAVVLGDIDLVRPLVLARIPVALVAPPGDAARRSRYTTPIASWDPRSDNDELVDVLDVYGRRQKERPVLFYQSDEHLLFVARHQARLRERFRFVLDPRAPLLVDKDWLAQLALTLDLPMPPTRTFVAGPQDPTAVLGELPLPVIVKPARRADHLWAVVEPAGKAVVVRAPSELAALWPRLVQLGRPVVAQTYIPGPESRIESYHVYVAGGEVLAEFTGRKIRTLPLANGHTTALAITSAPDVAECGRRVVRALELQGVGKLDFKRAPDNSLHLLEVNPRFTLWHHAAARAGVNVPALVYSDLTGGSRRAARPARAGVCWCSPDDLFAARQEGISLPRWLSWAIRCEAKLAWARDDPLPFVSAALRRLLSRAQPAHP
jgi:D-aspartate ligase